MRTGQLVFVIAAATMLPLGGCELIDKIPPPTSANRPVYSSTQDAWKRSALWLYATEGAPGGQVGECRRMLELLEGELGCKGALCKTGSELSTEWLGKCAKLVPDGVETVKAANQTMREQAAATPSPCATEYDKLLESGCQPDTCREKAQSWATRCGDHEAGALTGAILQLRVSRRVGGKAVDLDLRGCASIEKALLEGTKCSNEAECRNAMPDVEAYAARCQGEGKRPNVTTAVAQLAITAGANHEAKPITVAADIQPLSPDRVPLTLADGSGAILSLCHQRPVDLDGFLSLQQRCVGTPLTIARLFFGKGGEPSVQVGQLPAPERFEPPSPYPWLEIAGERAHYAKHKATALQAELDAVGATSGPASLGKLVRLIDEYAPWLDRSPEVQKVLQEADTALIPLFSAAADTKVKGSKRVFDTAALRGFYDRSKPRPLADLSTSGAFALGANTEGYWLETEQLLPQATAAYRSRLSPLDQRVRFAPTLLPAVLAAAREEGIEHAKQCAQAQSKEQSVEHQLNSCVFSSCAEDRVNALVAEWQQARTRAKQERIAADVALGPTSGGAARTALAADQGCEELAW